MESLLTLATQFEQRLQAFHGFFDMLSGDPTRLILSLAARDGGLATTLAMRRVSKKWAQIVFGLFMSGFLPWPQQSLLLVKEIVGAQVWLPKTRRQPERAHSPTTTVYAPSTRFFSAAMSSTPSFMLADPAKFLTHAVTWGKTHKQPHLAKRMISYLVGAIGPSATQANLAKIELRVLGFAEDAFFVNFAAVSAKTFLLDVDTEWWEIMLTRPEAYLKHASLVLEYLCEMDSKKYLKFKELLESRAGRPVQDAGNFEAEFTEIANRYGGLSGNGNGNVSSSAPEAKSASEPETKRICK